MNGLWMQRNAQSAMLPDFRSTAQRYRAHTFDVDFAGAPERAREEINAFARRRSGQEADLLPSGAVSSETRLIAVNTTTFDAAWSTPFDERLEEGTFRGARSSVVVPFMKQIASLRVCQFRDQIQLTAVRLPYLGKCAMLVLVPDAPSDLGAVVAWLSNDGLQRLHGAMTTRRVEIHMPLVTTVTERRLSGPLRNVGLDSVFGAGAFSRINGEDLRLSEGYSRVCLNIDRNGTTATAATAMVVALSAPITQPPSVVVRVDRPFLAILLDTTAGSEDDEVVTFIGQICDLTATR